MKVRTYVLLLAVMTFAAALPAYAQGQETPQGNTQASSAQTGPQGASMLPASTADTQGIRKYVLGPGDTLDVRVFGQSDLNWQGEVEADGNITSLPFIDTPIRAQCRTDKEVQKDIVTAYSKFLKSPQISVRVTGRNSRSPAVVSGAVAAPTRVQMLRPVHLMEVLTVSGGQTERANGDIQVLHTEPVMCPAPGEVVEPLLTPEGTPAPNTMKIYKLVDLLAGKAEANPVIRPGDIITVMESKPVYVTGSVASPQPVLLREGYTLSRVVAMVGGPTAGAKPSDIRIYRGEVGSPEMKTIHVDLNAIRKQKSADVVLQPYDIIEVPKNSGPGVTLKDLGKALLGGAAQLPIQAFQYRVIY